MTFTDQSASLSEYTGSFSNGKLYGEGMLSDLDGNVYEGEFNKGRMHGEGLYTL